MSYRRAHPFFLADPIGWLRVATRAAETMQASAQVIAHRTALMSGMGATPSAAEQRELHGMVQEKSDAAVESAIAMATKANRLTTTAAADLASRVFAGYARWWDWPMGEAYAFAPLKGSRSAAAAIMDAGLGPYHRRSRNNAKRLRKS